MLKGKFNRYYYLVSCILFALLFFCPVVLTLFQADFQSIGEILSIPYYRHIIKFSLYQSFISALCSLGIGLPGAWIMNNVDFRFKKTVKSIYAVPFILPSILVVLGFVIFYGNSGFLSKIIGRKLNLMYSFKAVIMAHVFYNFPVVITMISDSMSKLDRRIEGSAQNCGASDLRIFLSITLPRLLNSIMSSFLMVFLLCLTSFAIILILGGGPEMTTMEVEIYRLARINMDIPKAAALSMISIMIVSFILFLQNTLGNKSTVQEEISFETRKRIICRPVRVVSSVYVTLSVLFIICPVISVIIRSFIASSSRAGASFFSLKAYSTLDLECLKQTLFIALLSALTSVFMSLGILRHKNSLLTMLPFAVSSAIIGLAYLRVSRYLSFFSGKILIVLSHAVIFMPFALKEIRNVYEKIPIHYEEIACITGCSQFRYFTQVELPILKNSIISSFLFCFCLSCGELNASMILGNSRVMTIPIQIRHMISSYNYQGACAWGTILTLLSFLFFRLGECLKDRN